MLHALQCENMLRGTFNRVFILFFFYFYTSQLLTVLFSFQPVAYSVIQNLEREVLMCILSQNELVYQLVSTSS